MLVKSCWTLLHWSVLRSCKTPMMEQWWLFFSLCRSNFTCKPERTSYQERSTAQWTQQFSWPLLLSKSRMGTIKSQFTSQDSCIMRFFCHKSEFNIQYILYPFPSALFQASVPCVHLYEMLIVIINSKIFIWNLFRCIFFFYKKYVHACIRPIHCTCKQASSLIHILCIVVFTSHLMNVVSNLCGCLAWCKQNHVNTWPGFNSKICQFPSPMYARFGDNGILQSLFSDRIQGANFKWKKNTRACFVGV